MLEFVTLTSLLVAVASAFAAGWLWFESSYWKDVADTCKAELWRTQQDLGDARGERDMWEKECIGHEIETL